MKSLLDLFFSVCIFQFGVLAAPNVLFVAVDDMNDWVGCLDGHPQTQTPNIDRLAKRGMLFANAHCPSPLCGPSRAAVMTGLRPSTTGVYGNGQWIRPNLPEVKTIPEHFKANNYYVAGAGKIFHHTAGSNPPDQWNQFRRMTYDDPWDRESRTNYPWTEVVPKPEGHPFSGLWMGHEGDWGAIPNLAEKDYSDAKSVEYCAEFLDTYEADKPFFLACGLFHPHLPWYVPQKYFDQFPLESIELPALKKNDLDDLPPEAMKMAKAFAAYYAKIKDSGKYREAVRAYLANIAFADAQVWRLLEALDDSGHAGNTIIVFWSDHGWHLGEKQRWLKAALWERTTRVPFIIAAPGVSSPGSRSSRPVNLIDIFATLNELCGLPEKTLDSESLVPLLRDPGRQWHPTLTTFKYGNHSIRSERFRYTRYHGGGEEVYDLQRDPHEWRNLAGTEKGDRIVSELSPYIPTSDANELPLKGAFDFDPDTYSWTRKDTVKDEGLNPRPVPPAKLQ